jgi:hypothetical protein
MSVTTTLKFIGLECGHELPPLEGLKPVLVVNYENPVYPVMLGGVECPTCKKVVTPTTNRELYQPQGVS